MIIQKCPLCGASQPVRILDHGIKKALRWLFRNNRYVCIMCSVTWRARNPETWQKIRRAASESAFNTVDQECMAE